MMINYKISEQLKNQLDNLSHDKYDKIKNFLQELLNPKKKIKVPYTISKFPGLDRFTRVYVKTIRRN